MRKNDTRAPFVFGREVLDRLTGAARASARRRMNLDLHAAYTHPANRLLNALEPDSYVRPHRHLAAHKDETFVVLRGAFGLLVFDDAGAVTREAVLRAGGELVGADVPQGAWHALVALEPGSVFFEVKAGPYDPATDKDWPAWAPAEGSPEAAAYHATLLARFAG